MKSTYHKKNTRAKLKGLLKKESKKYLQGTITMSDSFVIDEKTMDNIISGVLFDFMGWLSTRDSVLSLGSKENCAPAVEVIKEFCKMRNVSMDNADVVNWDKQSGFVYPNKLKENDSVV